MLQGLVARIAQAGRLRVDVAHATDLIHAAGTGVALTLAATPPEERDPRLSKTMREAILTAITAPAAAEAPNEGPDAAPAAERVAVHAVALRALLTDVPSVMSPAERQLLGDWLDRLATANSPGARMRRSPSVPRADAQRQSLEELSAWASASDPPYWASPNAGRPGGNRALPRRLTGTP